MYSKISLFDHQHKRVEECLTPRLVGIPSLSSWDFRVYTQDLGYETNHKITWKWWRHIWKGLNCLRQILYKSTLTLFWITERNEIDSWAVTVAVLRIFMYLSKLSSLRWGWVFLERTRILSGIQFTTHFIDFFVVETKRFVGSSVHVILTRQTCGQRSSKVAESKRRAPGNHFFDRICYMVPISKCRGDWDLGLCTTSRLAFGEPMRDGKIRFFLRRNTFLYRKSPMRCGSGTWDTRE